MQTRNLTTSPDVSAFDQSFITPGPIICSEQKRQRTLHAEE